MVLIQFLDWFPKTWDKHCLPTFPFLEIMVQPMFCTIYTTALFFMPPQTYTQVVIFFVYLFFWRIFKLYLNASWTSRDNWDSSSSTNSLNKADYYMNIMDMPMVRMVLVHFLDRFVEVWSKHCPPTFSILEIMGHWTIYPTALSMMHPQTRKTARSRSNCQQPQQRLVN